MSAQAGRAVRMAYLIAIIAGVAFFAMSVVLLGVWPKRVLDAQTAAMAPARTLALTASETRGRAIYAREGCAYCHTQQIRYLHADMVRFGAPALAWETRFDYPQMWGTRRIGPDLSRESGNRSADWQYAHLYSPRAIVPLSVMPAYRALFDGAPDRPAIAGRDLVGYLETLGRARELAWPEGDARARAACNCPDDEMAQMAFAADSPSAHPARARRTGDVPAFPAGADRAVGARLFRDHCASCHGASGAGDGPGAAGLLPRPSNLAAHQYTRSRIAEALWNGVSGTSMPAWRDHPLESLAALVEAVRALTTSEVGAGASVPQPTSEVGAPVQPPLPTSEVGARVYAANCVPCHGDRGAGDGFGAAALPVAPTNFVQQTASLTVTLDAIRHGVAGTPMAPWTSG